jgi:hypothetical protein
MQCAALRVLYLRGAAVYGSTSSFAKYFEPARLHGEAKAAVAFGEKRYLLYTVLASCLRYKGRKACKVLRFRAGVNGWAKQRSFKKQKHMDHYLYEYID